MSTGPRNAVEVALLVRHDLARRRQEVVDVPALGRRALVFQEIVERREPSRAQPPVDVDEGDVQHVVRRSSSGQLEIDPLVVDEEARRVVVDLDAGQLLEFRQIGLQQLGKGRAPAGDVELDSLEGLGCCSAGRAARQGIGAQRGGALDHPPAVDARQRSHVLLLLRPVPVVGFRDANDTIDPPRGPPGSQVAIPAVKRPRS